MRPLIITMKMKMLMCTMMESSCHFVITALILYFPVKSLNIYFHIQEIVKELNRVLKENGEMLITVPFVWNEHEIPYDFGRYTSFGIIDLLQKMDLK